MQFQFDDFNLNTERYQLMRNGEVVRTEPQVMELLIFLLENRGRLVSRTELNDNIWHGRVVSESALSSRIKVARQVLGDNGRQQRYIQTIPKKGFTFSTDVDVRTALDVDTPDREYHASEFVVFENLSAGRKPSIAVIDFDDLGSDATQQCISDGISEDIATTLSKISKLTVMVYPTRSEVGETVAEKLDTARKFGIDYLLDGSVRSDPENLRISARLIEVSSGRHRWAQRYDRKNSDIFDLQDDITKEVVSALQVELTDGDQALLASRGTGNLQAWQLTVEAQILILSHRQDSVRRGIELLEEAVIRDDQYVLAWNMLATGHWKEAMNEGWSRSRSQSLELAVECSDTALLLDSQNARGLAARSLIAVTQRRFNEACRFAEQALGLACCDANTMALSGITLRACCKPEMAIKCTLKAMRLCPIYPAWYPYGIAICHWIQGNYDDAFRRIEEAIRIDPGLSLNYFVLVLLYAETGQLNKTTECIDRLYQADPGFSAEAYINGMPFGDPGTEKRRADLLRMTGLLT